MHSYLSHLCKSAISRQREKRGQIFVIDKKGNRKSDLTFDIMVIHAGMAKEMGV